MGRPAPPGVDARLPQRRCLAGTAARLEADCEHRDSGGRTQVQNEQPSESDVMNPLVILFRAWFEVVGLIRRRKTPQPAVRVSVVAPPLGVPSVAPAIVVDAPPGQLNSSQQFPPSQT